MDCWKYLVAPSWNLGDLAPNEPLTIVDKPKFGVPTEFIGMITRAKSPVGLVMKVSESVSWLARIAVLNKYGEVGNRDQYIMRMWAEACKIRQIRNLIKDLKVGTTIGAYYDQDGKLDSLVEDEAFE